MRDHGRHRLAPPSGVGWRWEYLVSAGMSATVAGAAVIAMVLAHGFGPAAGAAAPEPAPRHALAEQPPGQAGGAVWGGAPMDSVG